ncbi:hypothetical protein C8R42DRAFT_663978 [Lentinula raphanica]|nr:hypothetical protein C8R42DRAFT_663978 [Lentinula raphanica]
MLEKEAVDSKMDILSVAALHWLFELSSNHSVKEIVAQAIGGLPIRVKDEVQHVFQDSKIDDTFINHSFFIRDFSGETNGIKAGSEAIAERRCRTNLFFGFAHFRKFTSLFMTHLTPTQAATVLSGSSVMWNYDILKELIFFQYNLKHHPLVWLGIIKRSINVDSTVWDNYLQDPAIFKMLLPILWLKYKIHHPSKLYTMIQTISFYMADEFWQCFAELYHIAPLLTYPIGPPPGIKVLMHILNTALNYAIKDVTPPDNFLKSDANCWHWSVIDEFLAQASDHIQMGWLDQHQEIIFPWLVKLIEGTSIAKISTIDGVARQEKVLNLYRPLMFSKLAYDRKSFLRYGYNMQLPLSVYFPYEPQFSKPLYAKPPFPILQPQTLTSFSLAIEGMIQYISNNQDQMRHIGLDTYISIFHLLIVALEHRSENAYQLIYEYNGLQLLDRGFHEHGLKSVDDEVTLLRLQRRLVIAYVDGLLLSTPGTQHLASHIQESSTKYLQQPSVRQICALCCVQLQRSIGYNLPDFMVELSVEKLSILCSNVPLWQETVLWMGTLSNWFDTHAKARWMRPNSSVIESAEDQDALIKSFAEHALGEPWLLTIFISMMSWTDESWYKNDLAFDMGLQLRNTVRVFQNTFHGQIYSSEQATHLMGDTENMVAARNTSRHAGWGQFRQMISFLEFWHWTDSQKSKLPKSQAELHV